MDTVFMRSSHVMVKSCRPAYFSHENYWIYFNQIWYCGFTPRSV